MRAVIVIAGRKKSIAQALAAMRNCAYCVAGADRGCDVYASSTDPENPNIVVMDIDSMGEHEFATHYISMNRSDRLPVLFSLTRDECDCIQEIFARYGHFSPARLLDFGGYTPNKKGCEVPEKPADTANPGGIHSGPAYC